MFWASQIKIATDKYLKNKGLAHFIEAHGAEAQEKAEVIKENWAPGNVNLSKRNVSAASKVVFKDMKTVHVSTLTFYIVQIFTVFN